MRKLTLLALIAVFLLPALGQEPPKTDWTFVRENKGSSYYYHSKTLKYDAVSKTYRVWIKISSNGAALKNKPGKTSNVALQMFLVDFDCAESRSRIRQARNFSRRGNLLASDDYGDEGKWEDVVPDTGM